jgi:hypothetical protein
MPVALLQMTPHCMVGAKALMVLAVRSSARETVPEVSVRVTCTQRATPEVSVGVAYAQRVGSLDVVGLVFAAEVLDDFAKV